MSRVGNFFRNMRAEYKVALFFLVLLMLYSIYSLFLKDFINERIKNSTDSLQTESRQISRPAASSIKEAVDRERPVVIDPTEMKSKMDSIMGDKKEIADMELAAEVNNPTVWIYIKSDGTRKDDLASDYCSWLRENGIMASEVTILDAKARRAGKFMEIGSSRCD